MITEPIRSDWVGRVIDGRFTLLQWLGGTEASGVFLTELHEHGTQKAAIKLYPADPGDEQARFARWSATMALSHPHLMRLFHFGACQVGSARLLYAVTEYAEEILSDILPARPLTPAEAGEMLVPVLDALSYLHEHGFVHGRLKPSNIMAVNDQLKLSCDNLQFAGESVRNIHAPGAFDAPECATAPISPAADLWLLGATLVEVLTQHPPVWDRLRQGDPVVPESIPQPIAGIAHKCLRSDPERRSTLNAVKLRLHPVRFFLDLMRGIGGKFPAKFRLPAVAAFALIVIVVLAFSRPQSNPAPPSLPAAEEQTAPAVAAPPPPSPAPASESAKAAAAKGEVAERVLPDVPQKASETIQGKIQVNVRVTVDPGGNVSNAALDSPASSKYFANLALQAAQRWRFKPAQADGQAVSSVWLLHFQFTQAAPEVIAVEVSP